MYLKAIDFFSTMDSNAKASVLSLNAKVNVLSFNAKANVLSFNVKANVISFNATLEVRFAYNRFMLQVLWLFLFAI